MSKIRQYLSLMSDWDVCLVWEHRSENCRFGTNAQSLYERFPKDLTYAQIQKHFRIYIENSLADGLQLSVELEKDGAMATVSEKGVEVEYTKTTMVTSVEELTSVLKGIK